MAIEPVTGNSTKQPVIGRPFLPGQSGNPSGRPKGLPQLAHELLARTKQGREVMDWYLGIWRGAKSPLGHRPTDEQRMAAGQWITERIWGKPQVAIDVSAPSVIVVTA